MSRSKRTKITYAMALDMLPAAEQAVMDASLAYTKAYERAASALFELNAVAERERAKVAAARRTLDQLRLVASQGEGASIIVTEAVENPMITDGLKEDGATAAQWIKADRNMVTLIGGLARIDGCTKAQIEAAVKYRTIYENAQLGGSKATDYSAVKVDTSGPSEDAVAAIGAAARAEYAAAVRKIGMQASSVIEKVVVFERSLRNIASDMGLGDSGAARRKARAVLNDALNRLVDHFRLLPKARRPRSWDDGTPTYYSGESNRRSRSEAA